MKKILAVLSLVLGVVSSVWGGIDVPSGNSSTLNTSSPNTWTGTNTYESTVTFNGDVVFGGTPSSFVTTGPIFQHSVGGSVAMELNPSSMTVAVSTFVISGGKVGIGISNPTGIFTAHAGTNINVLMTAGLTDVTAFAIRSVNDAINQGTPLEFRASRHNFATGNVGIGASTPGNTFVVSGTACFVGADNATVIVSSINATQANVTATDLFIGFYSTTGLEASVAGTAGAGVIAFNTFTGSHFTLVVDADPATLPVLTPLESTGELVGPIKGLAPKDQLVRSRVCRTRGSKGIIGFYGGTDGLKETALALGTGFVIVANKGMDVAVGDLLMSSDVEGAVELQIKGMAERIATLSVESKDDVVRAITVAKARQPIVWKPGEKSRKIAVVYTCG